VEQEVPYGQTDSIKPAGRSCSVTEKLTPSSLPQFLVLEFGGGQGGGQSGGDLRSLLAHKGLKPLVQAPCSVVVVVVVVLELTQNSSSIYCP
jgi:hypothetical protein